MKESIIKNKTTQFLIRLAPAVAFALFSAYQIMLAIKVDVNRSGRLTGIAIYLVITVAAVFDLFDKFGLWIAHVILMVVSLVTLFVMRMFNASMMFESLDFSSIPSVLNVTVYILSQLGTLVLATSYLLLSIDLSRNQMAKLIKVFMIIVIAIYALTFVLECILMIAYRMNIDLRLRYSLPSRVLYLVGFAGTAFAFMLPAPKREPKKKKTGEFLYADDDDEEVELIM